MFQELTKIGSDMSYQFYLVRNYGKVKNSIRDARSPQTGEIVSTPRHTEEVNQYKDQETFRVNSVSFVKVHI